MTFVDRYGGWAIVTGAAQGMGAAFAVDAARRGLSVVLVDRERALLEDQAATVRAAGVDARTIVADLGAPGGADAVLDGVGGLDVGLFVSNAAASYVGLFLEQPLANALAQIDVNCRTPLILVHAFLPRMVARGRGGIVLLSSGSAQRGAPLVASYAATKAWNRILAESLWEEVRADGVDVMAVLPGSTRTPGWMSSRPQAGIGTANVMEPEDVAREVFDALGTAPCLIPGEANREAELFMATLDRTEAITLMGQAMREMYPADRPTDPTPA